MANSLLTLGVPWWELVCRAVVVYFFLLVLLRVTGKRQIGQLAPFDLVLLLVLSNAVQNSINGGDNSLLGGLVSAVVLVALNVLMGYLTYRSKLMEAIVEGRPQVLIHNGRVFPDVLRSSRVTMHELEAALRLQGCINIQEVYLVVLENNGAISVIPRKSRVSGTDASQDSCA